MSNPEKIEYHISNTMDHSVDALPAETVTLEQYRANQGVVASHMTAEDAALEAYRHEGGDDVVPLHRSPDSSAEATRTERRLHPYTFRN